MIKQISHQNTFCKIDGSEAGFAMFFLISIASATLLSFYYFNDTTSLNMSGNKQEIIAKQFFEMISAKIRSSIHKGELNIGDCDKLKSPIVGDFNRVFHLVKEPSKINNNIVTFKKLSQTPPNDKFCPFVASDLLPEKIKRSIDSYSIHISHAGISRPKDIPYRIIKISGEITVKPDGSSSNKKPRKFIPDAISYKIRLMSISEYGLLFWGSTPSIDVGDSKLRVHSDVLVTDSNQFIYPPKGPWGDDDPKFQILGKTHVVADDLDMTKVEVDNFDFEIYKNIYQQGVITGAYHFGSNLRDNLPKEGNEDAWNWGNVYQIDPPPPPDDMLVPGFTEDTKFFKKCDTVPFFSIPSPPSKVIRSNLANIQVTPFEDLKSYPPPPPPPPPSAKAYLRGKHSCQTNNYFVFTNASKDVNINFVTLPPSLISLPPDDVLLKLYKEKSFYNVFCGIITAETLTIDINLKNHKHFALVGIFNVNKIKITGNEASRKTVHIYNPLQSNRWSTFLEESFLETDENSAFNEANDLLVKMRDTSSQLSFNIFKPIFKVSTSTLFSTVKNKESVYPECSGSISNPKPRILRDSPLATSLMDFYGSSSATGKFRDYAGNPDRKPYYIISEYQ
ncbi:MAG: hypothetical protein OXC44_07225 [Proteobacteria bacterium]|nr:hypothetical protein [Pseudomonadota bacterium]